MKDKEVVSSPKDELSVTYQPNNDPVPIAKLIELRNKGLSYKDIGKIVDRSAPTIHERLQPFIQSVDHLQAVKDNRADTYAVIGDGIINSLTHEDIKKASLLQKVTSVGIMHDHERTERGLANERVDIRVLSGSIADLRRERERLEAEAGYDPDDDTVNIDNDS